MSTRVRVLYFGGSRGVTGTGEESLEFAGPASIAEVAAAVVERHPALAPHVPAGRWACNHSFVDADEPVDDGDEIAFIPPVAGGTAQHSVTEAALDPEEIARRVAGPDCGAVVLFCGDVRDNARGKVVTRLHYEAYEPMTTLQFHRIGDAIAERHRGTRVAIAHRVGDLAVGERAVVIAVAAPHREQAFDGCREALELLKTDAPIWKLELTSDGDEWVGFGGG